jgi:hypothetical protein
MPRKWRTRDLVFLLSALSCLVMAARHADAMSVRTLSLEDLTRRADRIFLGQCLAVRDTRSEVGQPITEISFKVLEAVKGVSGDTLTIRQLGGGSGLVPSYAVGQEVFLFLHPESSAGLTSPVGFGQGTFTVVRQEPDRKKAIAIGDGVRAGRRALKRALIASGGSTSASAVTAVEIQRDDEGGVELAPLIKAVRRHVAEDAQ